MDPFKKALATLALSAFFIGFVLGLALGLAANATPYRYTPPAQVQTK